MSGTVVALAAKTTSSDLIDELAASIIEGRPVTYEEIKDTLQWPNLQSRRDYRKCVLVYKALNSLAPTYLLSDFTHAHEVHRYNT